MNWESMTAISTALLALFTFVLMGATIWLAFIAMQAKNSWKNELKERKKLVVLRETNELLNKIYSHLSIFKFIIKFNSPEQEKEYLLKLHDMLSKLPDIQEELSFINYAEFSNLLISIVQKGNNCPVFQGALTNSKLINVSMQEKQKLELNALLENFDDLMNLIGKSKNICDAEIKKFYTK